MASLWGYFVATSVRTLPAYLTGKRNVFTQIRVSAPGDSRAFYMDPGRGDAALPLTSAAATSAGAELPVRCRPDVDALSQEQWKTIYEGPSSIVAGSTCPYYGGNMCLFPFARTSPSQMQLRVAAMSPFRFVPNVWGIFRGTYRNREGAFDFVGDEFKVDIRNEKDGIPMQHSGDAIGSCQSMHMKVAGSVRFVDFLGLPAVVC
jgi:hypothetical protein